MDTTEDASPGIAPRDLFLSPDLAENDARQYLARRGFADPAAADEHLQQLADDLPTRLALGELAPSLFEALTEAPNPDAALVGFCRYVSTRVPKSSFVGYLQDDPRALHTLTYLLGASPFLGEVLIRSPEYFHWLQRELDGPAPDRVDCRHAVETVLAQDSGQQSRLDALKRLRRRELLRIAGRDFLDKDTLRSSTEQLSNLADAMIDGVIRVLQESHITAGAPPLPGRFVVVGMGKLGGRELNYSSDIDLVYIYVAEAWDEPKKRDDDDDTSVAKGEPRQDGAAADHSAHERFQHFAKELTTALAQHTDEGYFYRVDLRLRPMGARGNIAYSLAQSRQYYEALGETFERFAMIKARAVAGDLELGQRFVDMVRPFVYRRYLDHAAIEELARYKARSDREHAKREPGDRNLKQGRGGIREVELFTQVFQLLYGGIHPELQQPHTVTALQTLREQGFIEQAVLDDLQQAYEFLRRVEHRLQVVQQSQTHSLSDEKHELGLTARRLGFTDVVDFTTRLEAHRQRVHAVYTNLFEHRSDDAEFQGRQLFRLLAGELTDDDAIAHLRDLGFLEPEPALQIIRALDDVASLAHSKSSTRNLLANLLATALEDISRCGSPTAVLNRLEHVVARTRGPAALYRSLLENAPLRHRLFTTLDTGELFAHRLGRYPELLDFLIPATIPSETFRPIVVEAFAGIDRSDSGAASDAFRRVKAIEEFKVLVEWTNTRSVPALTEKLSLLADTALTWAAEHALAEIRGDDRAAGGDVGRWVILALGKLGGQELTVHSDLDVVFLYDGDPSDSAPYTEQQAFVRGVYRILETQTEEGVAYHVDTRLRPEGKKGALAIPLTSFVRYLDTRAEIWERMAWTRCRVVAGSRSLGDEVRRVVDTFVYGSWDNTMPAYARHLRHRMERELSQEAAGTRYDLKVGRGGLADIDFLLQVVQIREGADRESFRVAGTRALLAALPENPYLEADDVRRLRRAYEFLRTLETTVRIDSDSGRGWISSDPRDLDSLAARMDDGLPTEEAFLERYLATTTDVREIFDTGMTRLTRAE